MPHIKFQSSPLKSGNNHGSCGQLLGYLEKEDKNREEGDELKGFFNDKSDHLNAENAKQTVEHGLYKKGLKNDADKFFSVTMSFSKEELKDKSNEELKEFAKDQFAKMYGGAVKGREIDPENIAWVAKLEEERKYKGTDQEVKDGLAKSGESKEKEEGDQRHIHFVVARKTLDDKQISPMSNHFRAGADTGAVKSGFDQDYFKFECEKQFDKKFNHERQPGESIKEHLAPYRPDLVELFKDKDKEKTVDILTAIKQEQEKFKEAEKKWDQSKTLLERTKDIFRRITEPVKEAAERIFKGFSTTIKKSSESINRSMDSSILDRLNEKKEPEQDKNKDKGNDYSRGL